jgi:putative hydroxymethylpyrimidine transport system substrate-binding protein
MRRALALVTTGACLAAIAAGAACGEQSDRAARGGEAAARPLTLALDFTPNAAHAGIYAAREARADRARGVDLRVRAPSASTDSLKLLKARRADVAVADIQDLGLARQGGADLVGVGAIVQRPLAAIIARPPVRRPRELEGRRVGVAGLPSDDAVLRAIVAADGGDPGRVRRTTIGFSAVPALVSGRVAAATAFWNAEGVALRRRGVRTREFRVGEYSTPRYPELVLVVRRESLGRERERVEAVVGAVRAGTERAVRDPRAALAAVTRASASDPSDVRAQFEAVRPALTPAVRLDPGDLEGWATFAARFGILRERPDVAQAFDVGLSAAR